MNTNNDTQITTHEYESPYTNHNTLNTNQMLYRFLNETDETLKQIPNEKNTLHKYGFKRTTYMA